MQKDLNVLSPRVLIYGDVQFPGTLPVRTPSAFGAFQKEQSAIVLIALAADNDVIVLQGVHYEV